MFGCPQLRAPNAVFDSWGLSCQPFAKEWAASILYDNERWTYVQRLTCICPTTAQISTMVARTQRQIWGGSYDFSSQLFGFHVRFDGKHGGSFCVGVPGSC